MGLLISLALAMLLLSAVLGQRRNNSIVDGSTVFWLSWSTLLGSAWISQAYGIHRDPPPSAMEYGTEGLLGAAVGTLAGHYLGGRRRRTWQEAKHWGSLVETCEGALNTWRTPLLTTMVILGLAHFVARWSSVDFDLFRILELRVQVISDTEFGFLYRVTSYLQIVVGFLAMLAGTADARYGVRAGRLAAIWLSLVLPGLALGGRGWTVAPQLVYLFAHFVSLRCEVRRIFPWRSYLPVAGLLLVGLWSFTVIGTIRGRDLNRDQVESLSVSQWDTEQRLMAVTYIGGSLSALGTVGKAAEQIGPAPFESTLYYIASKSVALGYSFGETASILEKWRFDELPREPDYGWTWCVPPTAMAYLLLDFGRVGMPIAMAVLLAMGQWLSVHWVGRGVFKHAVALLSVNTMFSTIHGLNVLSPFNVATLLLAASGAILIRAVAMLRRQEVRLA